MKTNTRGARRRNIAKGAQYETLAVITVQTTGAALAMMDMAGKRSSAGEGPRARPNFVPLLNERLGRSPSRFMWAGGEKAIPDFQRELKPSIDRVIYRANQELMKVKL